MPTPAGGARLVQRASSELRLDLLGHAGLECPPGTVLIAAVSLDKRIRAAMQTLDAAILQVPGDSTGWFLRAMCHDLKRDRLQADRDMRRVAALESEANLDQTQFATRLRRIEMPQGSLRRTLNTRLKNARERSADPPLRLAEIP